MSLTSTVLAPTLEQLHDPAFWAAAPAYDSLAFWEFVLRGEGEDDAYGRNLVIAGYGAAGPIRHPRDYAEWRRRLAKGRSFGERMARERKARKAAQNLRIRAIPDGSEGFRRDRALAGAAVTGGRA